MKIKWLGHASFLITSDSGTRVITDPYPSGLKGILQGLKYRKIRDAADVITVSHNHSDHNNVSALQGNPQVIKSEGIIQISGITFRGISGSHGRLRGTNTVFCFAIDGIRLCHLGDQAEAFTEQQFDEIGDVDILFLPLIGLPLIRRIERCPTQLDPLLARTNSKMIIPMHFRNWKCWLPFPTIDGYLRNKNLKDKMKCTKLDTNEITLSQETLPQEREMLILKPH